jgi:tagatose 1,6-diphosphate aldolase GatY/KbaY
MPIANTLEMLRTARRHGYAVPGFEPYNLEQIQAVIEAAVEERAPVLLQLWSEVMETWGTAPLVAIIRDAAGRAGVPIGIHLDHARSERLVYEAVDAGFSSVMFDGSALPLEENIMRTRAVVERAHAKRVAVEAELGIIGQVEADPDPEEVARRVAKMLTDPQTAQRFVRETGVDILAPAVGTIHGCQLPFARLDIARIAAIADLTGVPLALHGGSGAGEEPIRSAVAAGIAKINIDTEVRTQTIASLKAEVAKIGETGEPIVNDFARYPRGVKAATREAVRSRIRMVGASGKA